MVFYARTMQIIIIKKMSLICRCVMGVVGRVYPVEDWMCVSARESNVYTFFFFFQMFNCIAYIDGSGIPRRISLIAPDVKVLSHETRVRASDMIILIIIGETGAKRPSGVMRLTRRNVFV